MRKTGGGGDGEIAGIARGMWVVEGRGGMWLRKMGQEWDKNGETPIFHSPMLPIFLKVKDLPHSSLSKIGSPHSPTEKWELMPLTNTHRHNS